MYVGGFKMTRYEWNYDGKGGFIAYKKSNIGLGDIMVFYCGATFIDENRMKNNKRFLNDDGLGSD